MPFVGPDPAGSPLWVQIHTVDLRQLPVTRRWKVNFAVLREFGYTDLPPDAGEPLRPAWTARSVQHLIRKDMVTDLASVPPFLWGVIASYGRQTLPALLHDMQCYAAAQPHQPAAYRRRARREADTLFRATLRASGSGPIRRWLMWAAVRLFGRVSVAVSFALLVTAGLVWLVGALAGASVVAAVAAPMTALLAGVVLVVGAFAATECDRTPPPAAGWVGRPDGPADPPGATGATGATGGEYTATRFDPRAFTSILLAALVGATAAPPVVVLGAATSLTELIVGWGERTVPVAAEGAGLAPAPDVTGPVEGAPAGAGEGAVTVPEDAVASAGSAVGATARITWSPLVEPAPSTPDAAPPATDG